MTATLPVSDDMPVAAGATRPDVHAIVNAIAGAALGVAETLRHGPHPRFARIGGPDVEPDSMRSEAERLLLEALSQAPVAGVCTPDTITSVDPNGTLLVTLDPLNDVLDVEVNGAVGTIFGILPVRAGQAVAEAVAQPGSAQLAAGMVLYGPSTMLVMTMGAGTDAFLLDADRGGIVTTGRRVEIPVEQADYTGRPRFSEAPDPGCVNGPLSSIAYRVLVRGGACVVGQHDRPVLLVQQANPVALLCEQAGGRACDGARRILDLVPDHAWQSTRMVFGSRNRVDRLCQSLHESAAPRSTSPLFTQRGLLRP